MSRENKLPTIISDRPSGDGLRFPCHIKNADHTSVDLTGYVWEAQVRDTLGGRLICEATVTPATDYSDGRFVVEITGAQSATMPRTTVLGVRGTLPGGEPFTFLQGQIVLTEASVK